MHMSNYRCYNRINTFDEILFHFDEIKFCFVLLDISHLIDMIILIFA